MVKIVQLLQNFNKQIIYAKQEKSEGCNDNDCNGLYKE